MIPTFIQNAISTIAVLLVTGTTTTTQQAPNQNLIQPRPAQTTNHFPKPSIPVATSTTSYPTELNLSVPFTTQAPYGNWSGNKDCEEASVVMAYTFLTGQIHDVLPADYVSKQIEKLKAWENENFNYNADTGAGETATMIKAVYGLKTDYLVNFTEADLKQAISQYKVVILPLNAQFLAPSNYPDLHPTYHMAVIRGYQNNLFFINDPGTSTGKNNAYTFDEIKKIAADWDPIKNGMDLNKKVAVVVSK